MEISSFEILRPLMIGKGNVKSKATSFTASRAVFVVSPCEVSEGQKVRVTRPYLNVKFAADDLVC